MILLVLICVVIGWICGAPLIGLAVGVAITLLSVWAESSPLPRARARRRLRNRRRR